MNQYDWYKIFNLTEFEALDLVSKEYSYYLTGLGLKTILVTKGNFAGITVDGNYLAYNMNTENPFEFNDVAIYKDESNDIWYGVKI